MDGNTTNSTLHDTADPALDRLLTMRLCAELDAELGPQLGKARAQFEAGLIERSSWRSSSLRALGAALAMAACVVVGAGVWLNHSDRAQVPAIADNGSAAVTLAGGGHESAPPSSRFAPVRQDEFWRSRNLGTYLLDGQPVQAIERQGWQTLQLTDERGGQVTIETPHHEMLLIDAPVH